MSLDNQRKLIGNSEVDKPTIEKNDEPDELDYENYNVDVTPGLIDSQVLWHSKNPPKSSEVNEFSLSNL